MPRYGSIAVKFTCRTVWATCLQRQHPRCRGLKGFPSGSNGTEIFLQAASNEQGQSGFHKDTVGMGGGTIVREAQTFPATSLQDCFRHVLLSWGAAVYQCFILLTCAAAASCEESDADANEHQCFECLGRTRLKKSAWGCPVKLARDSQHRLVWLIYCSSPTYCAC